jgi:hypothetical protein
MGAGPDSATELLPGLVERVPFYNPENGFCMLQVSLVRASRLSRDEGTATGRGLIQFVKQGRVGLYQPDRLHGEICRNQPSYFWIAGCPSMWNMLKQSRQ